MRFFDVRVDLAAQVTAESDNELEAQLSDCAKSLRWHLALATGFKSLHRLLSICSDIAVSAGGRGKLGANGKDPNVGKRKEEKKEIGVTTSAKPT